MSPAPTWKPSCLPVMPPFGAASTPRVRMTQAAGRANAPAPASRERRSHPSAPGALSASRARQRSGDRRRAAGSGFRSGRVDVWSSAWSRPTPDRVPSTPRLLAHVGEDALHRPARRRRVTAFEDLEEMFFEFARVPARCGLPGSIPQPCAGGVPAQAKARSARPAGAPKKRVAVSRIRQSRRRRAPRVHQPSSPPAGANPSASSRRGRAGPAFYFATAAANHSMSQLSRAATRRRWEIALRDNDGQLIGPNSRSKRRLAWSRTRESRKAESKTRHYEEWPIAVTRWRGAPGRYPHPLRGEAAVEVQAEGSI